MADTDKEQAREAFERILSHAESHGEVYAGAVEDQAIVRAVLNEADSVDEPESSDTSGADDQQ